MLSGLVSGIRTWGSAGPEALVNLSSEASSRSSSGASETRPGGQSSTSSSATEVDALPAAELIDLGGGTIEPTPNQLR
jgi:hypothetical protein